MASRFCFTEKADAEKRMNDLGVNGKIITKTAKAQADALRAFKKEGQSNPALAKLLATEVPVYIFEGDSIEDDIEYYGEDWWNDAARMKTTSDQLDIARRKAVEDLNANVLKLIAGKADQS